MPHFYDTHAHLDFPDFASDLEQIIARAQAAGIAKIISVGTDLEKSRRAIQLAEKFDCVYAVVGWHPSDALQSPADLRQVLGELARRPKVVALGETGLDYYRLPGQKGANAADDELYKARQAELFRQHLEVAEEAGLNCVIHQRGDCFADTLKIFKPFASRVRGVFHCFAGDAGAMEQILALNSLVSFTGIATFKNGQNVRGTIAATPLDRFMLETDCPFLAPVPYRGNRCEPAYVKEISETVATVKNCSLEKLSEATCGTAENFFRFEIKSR